MTQLNHGSISTARRFIACPAACADIALSASTMSSTRCSILCWCRCRHMRGRQCQTSPSSGRAPRTHGVSADKRTRTEQQGRSWQRQRHVTPAVSRSYPLYLFSIPLCQNSCRLQHLEFSSALGQWMGRWRNTPMRRKSTRSAR